MDKDKEDLKCEVVKEDFLQYDLSFKIIVIGDTAVGKSCLTMKATKDYFENYYSPTVGFEFFTFNCKINDQSIRLQIWDTCGQEEYRSLIQNFYRNSSLAILVYAIDNIKSFENLEIWLNEVKVQGSPDVKIFLIGNKIDLEERREVSTENGKKFYKDNKLNLFLETSAKAGTNVQDVFINAAKVLYLDHTKYKDRISRPDSVIRLPSLIDENQDILESEEDEGQSNRKKGCCSG